MLKPIVFLSAALAALSAPAAAAAPGSSDARTVAYKDLNLDSAAGRARFERRIDTAIRNLCGEAPTFDLVRRQAVRECRAEARASLRIPASVAASLSEAR